MLRLAAVFGEHMVLQRGKPIAVFGEADGPVEITLAQHSVTAACEGGRFLAHLPPITAGGPYTLTARCGEESVALGDVMVGEVWLCGGQSNMEFRLRDERHCDEADAMRDSRVRFYEVPQAATVGQAETLERNRAWTPLAPGACAEVSAISFYAARWMAQRLNVAVGMIVCCIGGTSAGCWMSEETLSGFPEGRAYLTEFEAHVAGKTDEQFARESEAYQRGVDGWNAASAAIKAENPDIPFVQITARIGDFPWPPPWGRMMLRRPAGQFETMLTRVAPYTLRGFLFYQGEQDSTPARAPGYASLLTALIAQWRALFEDESIFFVAAQLPRFGAEPSAEDWPAIRAAQQQVIDITPNAALTCLLDCGERDNVHPTDKRTPGERLAATTLRYAYGMDVLADAPRLTGAALEGERLILRFEHTGGGLRVPENVLSSLTVEGTELMDVRCEGEQLVLTLASGGRSVRVHYAQENWPEAILTGENGLPVFPFDAVILSCT